MVVSGGSPFCIIRLLIMSISKWCRVAHVFYFIRLSWQNFTDYYLGSLSQSIFFIYWEKKKKKQFVISAVVKFCVWRHSLLTSDYGIVKLKGTKKWDTHNTFTANVVSNSFVFESAMCVMQTAIESIGAVVDDFFW